MPCDCANTDLLIIGNLSGTTLGTRLKLVTSVIQQVSIIETTQFLIELCPAIICALIPNGGIIDLLYSLIIVSLAC